MDTLPKEADSLFAVAADDFVDERKRVARALRDEGRRADAEVVAALRKPPPVVLAANRAARDRPQAARAAAKAAERVAKTQLGADPEGYRAALAELDESLDLLAQVALAQLSRGGKRPTDAVTRRLRDLLRNAVADEEARTAAQPGRAQGGDLALPASARSPPSRRAPGRRAYEGCRDSAEGEDEQQRRKNERALRDELARAEKTLDEAQSAQSGRRREPENVRRKHSSRSEPDSTTRRPRTSRRPLA